MFVDRVQAGELLGAELARFADSEPVVLALPRGGVPVAHEVARVLRAPLDVLIVRKLGAPENPEFAFGAVGEGGVVVLDRASIVGLGIGDVVRDRSIAEAESEIDRRVDTYRHGRALTSVAGKTVIVVDDGLATGATAEAAVRVVRALGARQVVLAVPTGSRQAIDRLTTMSDAVVCLDSPDWFGSVGGQYEAFPQVSDEEVEALLHG